MDGKFHLHLEVENKDWHENSEVWSFPVNNKIRLGQATRNSKKRGFTSYILLGNL